MALRTRREEGEKDGQPSLAPSCFVPGSPTADQADAEEANKTREATVVVAREVIFILREEREEEMVGGRGKDQTIRAEPTRGLLRLALPSEREYILMG